MSSLRLSLAAFLLCLLCPVAWAAAPDQLRFEQLNPALGLPQSTVTAMLQDRDGFMWFAGQGGLTRYDGYRFLTFRHDPADPASISDNSVQALHEDRSGQLWVGTRNGLQRFNPRGENFSAYPPRDGKADYLDVRTIASDGKGILWITTRTGLVRLDGATGRLATERHDRANPHSLGADDVTGLAFDGGGGLWIGTQQGVDYLAPGTRRFTHFRIDDAASDALKRNAVRSLAIDRAGTLWVGTAIGLEAWRIADGAPATRRRFGGADGINPGAVTALFEDSHGTLWAGTQTDGLKRWDAGAGRFTSFVHQSGNPASLADNYVASLFEDRAGILWAGTWFGGASRVDLNAGGFRHVLSGALSNNKISAILGDGPRSLWLATYGGGINRYDLQSGQTTVYRHDARAPHSLNDDLVTALGRDRHGQLWVGTRNGGLSRFDPASGRFTPRAFATGDALSDFIQAIVPDRAGMLWIASRGGLHRLDPRTNQAATFRHDAASEASLSDNFIWAILEDTRGRLWVGTSNGLDLFDPASGRFRHARHESANPASLIHNRVSFLHEAANGALWVGTGGGLSRLVADRGGKLQFKSYALREGLANPAVDGILEDERGHLWVSNDGGIADFDPRKETFRNYTSRDGMAEGDYFVGAAWRHPDGIMFFGSFNSGFTMFDPREVRGNERAPPVVITDIQIYNQSVRSGPAPNGFVLDAPIQRARQVVLSHAQSVFSFEFAALHFADPQRNQYAYQLEGVDRSWVATDAGKRFATYTNLDPGNYVFRVKASNKDGIWNEAGVALAITITPPFWKTWWFRLAAGLFVLACVYAAHSIRVRVLLGQKRELARQVAASLEGLQNAQQQLVLHEKMASLGTLSAGIAHEINNPGNFAHAGAQVLATELERFRAFLLALAGADADAAVIDSLNGRIDALVRQSATILEGTSRIRDLVRDLGTFARPDEGAMTTAPIGPNLLATVHLVRTLYASVANIGCVLEADPPLACWPAQLNQVFMNLIVNACHAIEDKQRRGGDFAPGMLAISSRTDGAWLYLDFEDSGSGIDPAVIDHIYEPFFTTKPTGHGTGLGLSISFGIVERHGGSLTVRSKPGQGSRFTVRLPLPA
ncbi:two-component regulator propeller domain-containing protein [Massilia antarctica]|uniref:two-component regulator propeller domain-containing protein n=1 Tax=Massilia antarctica TaxID=2765360 RepID=UPI0022706CDA|nr:two-component regulator propeller domain-containing protein [Massilia sp. H27-R4]MCY0911653.1 ATP-binding protein [Massilia sp. H27-R4]